jgi:dihydrofolate reductase
MRKIITSTFVSFDGVMQAPGGPEEDPTGGFTEGGWSFSYWDGAMQKTMGENMATPFDLLLGRKTYEIFAAHWPYAAGDNPITVLFNKATKYVASHSLDKVGWINSQLLKGDIAAEVARLKQGEGPDLQVHGSSMLLQTLTRAQLVDEYRVWIFPLVLGHGKRLFETGTPPQGLALADSKTSTTGVLMNVYRPAGAVKPGSFALAAPAEAELARRQKMAREG